MFIAVDGPNGVGKTTLCQELTTRLEQEGQQVLSLREPSDTDLGNFIRNEHHRIHGLALAALVVGDRLFQVETAINPALANDSTVVVDRYVASTLVLQRIDGIDPDLLWEMNAQARIPDLTIILFASPEILAKRLDRRGRTSRFDQHPGISELENAYFRDAAERLTVGGYEVMSLDTDALAIEGVARTALARIHALR